MWKDLECVPLIYACPRLYKLPFLFLLLLWVLFALHLNYNIGKYYDTRFENTIIESHSLESNIR